MCVTLEHVLAVRLNEVMPPLGSAVTLTDPTTNAKGSEPAASTDVTTNVESSCHSPL